MPVGTGRGTSALVLVTRVSGHPKSAPLDEVRDAGPLALAGKYRLSALLIDTDVVLLTLAKPSAVRKSWL